LGISRRYYGTVGYASVSYYIVALVLSDGLFPGDDGKPGIVDADDQRTVLTLAGYAKLRGMDFKIDAVPFAVAPMMDWTGTFGIR
jgi:hypothetical protein